MVRCFVALGGNIGPVAEQFSQALVRLQDAQNVRVGRQSSLYRTAAVGDDAGGDFLNAAVELQTDLQPLELLDLLKTIEDESGRTRNVRWGPRPLDLDLILYGDEVIDHPRLTVPHPACWYRRFVLDPLAEIAAVLVHPIKQLSIGELRTRLLDRPLEVGLVGGSPAKQSSIVEAIGGFRRQTRVFAWQPSDPTPALLAWLGEEQTEPARASSSFDQLPLVPRLDVSRVDDPCRFLQHVLESALLEPQRQSRPLRNTP